MTMTDLYVKMLLIFGAICTGISIVEYLVKKGEGSTRGPDPATSEAQKEGTEKPKMPVNPRNQRNR